MRFGSPGGAPSVKLAASAARKVCLPSSMRRAWEWRRRINAPAWAARALLRILCPSASLLLSAGGCSFVVGFCYLCIDLLSLIAQTASPMKLKPSLFPAIVFLAVLAIQLLPGCTPSPERSRLEHIESIIDEHPDSAMIMLDSVDTAALRSDRDRALYDLLYNLALYKSFNDSLNEESLKFSSNHFTDNKEYSRAAKSYYLLGNLYEARKNFGQSAVSQTKGIEMARKAKDNYALGLCEMSLWAVYGKIYDTNRQIIAAKSAQDAFDKCSRNDWKIYATLNLATAFNNNGNYDSAIIIANEIINDPVNWKDSILIGSAYETIALSAMDINDSLSITSYAKALRYNGFSLSSGANENIGVLLSSINQNIISESDRYILNEYLSKIGIFS